MQGQVNYDYLKTWLDPKWLQKIRSGDNPLGQKLTRQQVWRIMKGSSQNFEFRNLLVRKAMENERLSTLNQHTHELQTNHQSQTA